jgi:hypothetical protein
MIKAVGLRVGEEDPSSLKHLVAIQSTLDRAWAHAIEGLRQSGEPDREIGEALGVTQQAISKRWPR